MPLYIDKLVMLRPFAIYFLTSSSYQQMYIDSSLQVDLRGSTNKQHDKHENGKITDCFAIIRF